MRWPFTKRTETRSSGGGYEDQILAAFEGAATSPAKAGATAAVEAAASLAGRCLASARVTGAPDNCVGPAELQQMGRALVRRGQTVWRIAVDPEGMVRLALVGHWDHYGLADPATWTMRLSEYGPSGTATRTIPWAGVVDVKLQVDRVRPWWGVSPLAAAHEAGRLSAEVVSALADGESGPRGAVLPMSVDGQDPSVTALRKDLGSLRGKLAMVESVRSVHTGSPGSAPQDDWKPRRLGNSAPEAEVQLLARAFVEVLSACGVPPALFSERSDGTAQRESFRRYLHSTLDSTAKVIAAELSTKLGTEVDIDLSAIHAADVQGRARAWRSLVGKDATMTPEAAAMLVGLETNR